MAKNQKVTLTLREFDPEKKCFEKKQYSLVVSNLTTVLDALLVIKESVDPKVSFRYSCRMGICGSCGMVINGKPSLACETNLVALSEKQKKVVVEPIQGQPILRGLVSDFDDFFEKHKSVTPWLIRRKPEERFSLGKEFHQTEAQRVEFLPFAECIKCGLCVDACPVSNTNKEFKGPQALAQAYRYYADNKDQGAEERLKQLDTVAAVWGCEFSGSCSRVCPKNVDPALAIQLLKGEVAKYRLTGMAKKHEEERI